VTQLGELSDPALIFPDVSGTDVPSVLRDLANRVAKTGRIGDADALFERLWEREELGSTGIGRGVAIPHCKYHPLKSVMLSIAISREGVDFGAVDGKPVRLFFVVISPSKNPALHLKSLASISRWIKSEERLERILTLDDPQEIFELVRRSEG